MKASLTNRPPWIVLILLALGTCPLMAGCESDPEPARPDPSSRKSPVQASPVQASPVQASPVQASPVQASPAKSAQVQQTLNQLLVQATEQGDREKVRHLLAQGADPNAKAVDGRSALHAYFSGKNWRMEPELLEDLLRAGGDVRARDATGATPLHRAVARGRMDGVRRLLAVGAPLDAQDAHGATLLHLAAEKRDDQILQLLLERGAKVDLTDEEGRTPLLRAMQRGLTSSAYLLVAYDSDPRRADAYGEEPLPWLADQCVRALRRAADDAQRKDHPCMQNKVLRNPSLHLAAAAGQVELVELLLSTGADPSATFALAPGLSMAGTALHAAVVADQRGTVAALLSHGAPVDAADAAGWTALQRAVWQQNSPLVQQLLAAGASPSRKNRSGQSALDLARQRKSPALLRILKQSRPRSSRHPGE